MSVTESPPQTPKAKSRLGSKARFAAVDRLIAEYPDRYAEILAEERLQLGLSPRPVKEGGGGHGTLSIPELVARLERWEPRINRWQEELARLRADQEALARARSGFDTGSTDQEQRAQVAGRPG